MYAESSNPSINDTDDTGSHRLPVSTICGVDISPSHQYGEFYAWTKELKDTNPLMSSLLVICLGWCSNFVGSESGQKQSVKLLQNMVYSTIQHPPSTPPPTVTHCLHILYIGKGGRGSWSERRYRRGATVHKYSSFLHGGNSSQAGSKIQTTE